MTLVSPTQVNPNDEITDSSVNTPVNQIANVVNGNLDDTNVNALSGTKISSGTLPVAAATTDANVETRMSESLGDFVASGCVWSTTTGLGGAMTAGVVYIGGKRVAVSAVSSHTFTASKDTYISVDNTGTVAYQETSNGGTLPSLPSNSVWLYIGISGASSMSGFDDITIRNPRIGIIGRRKLSFTQSSLTINIPARKFLRIRATWLPSAAGVAANMRFNGDTGSNYNIRFSKNGGTESAGSAATSITTGPAASGGIGTRDCSIINVASREKSVYDSETCSSTAGAATTFDRFELVGKWANTSSQITSVTLFASSDSFLAETELVAYEEI